MTLAVTAVLATGCRKAAPAADAPGETLQQQPYQVTIANGTSMKANGAPVDVTVMDHGTPVTDVDVSIEMRMASTPSMGEMRTGADLEGDGTGHYRGQLNLGMSGKWTAIVRVKRGGQVVSMHSEPVDSVE